MRPQFSAVLPRVPVEVARYGWIPAIGVFVFVAVGDIGFSPLDEGFVLSQSWRVLQGQFPHADFISPRPLGSAYLHVLDFAVPLPLLDATRLVTALQVSLYSALLARFLFGRPIRRWNLFHLLGTAGSVFVNLHVFPLMAWHTIDGIMLLAIGLNLVDSGLRQSRRNLLWAGMACLGAAALVKQSFVPGLAIGGLWACWAHRRSPWRRQLTTAAAAAAAALSPIAGYVLLVAVGSGLDDMREQFQAAGSQRVLGQRLLNVFRDPAWRDELVFLVAAVTGSTLVAGLAALVRRVGLGRDRPALARAAAVAAVVVGGLLSAELIRWPRDNAYSYGHLWAVVPAWSLVAAVLVRTVVYRRVPWRALTVFLVAWMTMLSWGYAVPHLVSGSLVLSILHLVWCDTVFDWRVLRLFRLPLLLLAGSGLVVTVDGVLDARRNEPYFDQPVEWLSFPLSRVDPAFGRARTNPATGSYVTDVAQCMQRHPASRVAVLPDYPALYSLLRLHNPYPLDWMLEAEADPFITRILAATEALDRKGDYLVLYASISAFDLERPGFVASDAPQDDTLVRNPKLGALIAERLSGERVRCGSFTGFYAPS